MYAYYVVLPSISTCASIVVMLRSISHTLRRKGAGSHLRLCIHIVSMYTRIVEIRMYKYYADIRNAVRTFT